jgi:hypothetical protein
VADQALVFRFGRLLVASPPVQDLLLFAKHLFVAANEASRSARLASIGAAPGGWRGPDLHTGGRSPGAPGADLTASVDLTAFERCDRRHRSAVRHWGARDHSASTPMTAIRKQRSTIFSTCRPPPLVRFGCECLARADHGDQLGHRCDRPDQANREHNGDTDPYAHLHLLCVALSLAK